MIPEAGGLDGQTIDSKHPMRVREVPFPQNELPKINRRLLLGIA